MNNDKKELLIKAAYGDLSLPEKVKALVLIKRSGEAERFYKAYKKTADEVRKLRKGNLPSGTIEKLDSFVEEKTGRKRKKSFAASPGFVVAFSILLIAIFTFTFLKRNTNYYGDYNEQTVENATQETLASLKLVAKIFSKTKKMVVNDILVNKVSEPINNGLNQVEKIIK